MNERWEDLEEFPDYAISTFGEIMNLRTRRILKTHPNRQGVTMVNFYIDGVLHTRGIAKLVLSTFTNKPIGAMNTVIHLNGEKDDNSLGNLMWRPRAFAMRYHRQFTDFYYTPTKPLVLIEKDEVFDHLRLAAMAYGLLEIDIYKDIINQEGVWPYGFHFEWM